MNAASFAPQGVPNGSIARGSIFSIFGRNLGPTPGVSAPGLPLQISLGGVSVQVCQTTTNCIAALPLFVGGEQVNAIIPSDAPLGAVNVRVTFNGIAGNFTPARVVASGFGTFTVLSSGFGPGSVTNFVSATEQPINSTRVPAKPGQFVTIWGTGLGASLNGDTGAPQSGDLPVDVEVWIGGVGVTNKLYSGRSPEFPGLDQIVVQVPDNVPTGCYVPVALRTAHQALSNSVSMAISTDGSPCSDPANPLDAARAGGRTGIVLLNRLQSNSSLPWNLPMNITSDLAAGIFQDEPSADEPIGPWRYNRMYSLPPPGTCSTFSVQAAGLTLDLLASLAANGTRLSAGPQLTITGPVRGGAATPLPHARNFYGTILGSDVPLEQVMSLFFGSGVHRVSAPGGPDIGAFQVEMTPPPALTWINRDSFTTVTPGSAREVTWTGGDPQGLTLILGFSRAPITASAAGLVCVERTSAGRFTIPAWVTANLPSGGSGSADGLLSVTALPSSPVHFAATGLDAGFALFTYGQYRGIDIQ